MIYDLVLGDHTIHIKSDVILQKSDSKDAKKEEVDDEDGVNNESEWEEEDEEDDESEEDDEDEEGLEMHAKVPAELLDISNDDRGPLYHSLCNEELKYPKDARRYRIRHLEAKGSKASRVQRGIFVEDFGLPDPNLEYETRGFLGEEEEEEEEKEDKPATQISLAFLRVNKQVYREASTLLYTTRTFSFDDPATFAQFLSFKYNHIAKPPTPINGTVLLGTKRNSIRSIYMRAKTALVLRQKILWMSALDAAAFVLPELERIGVLFDLCYEGNERFMDRTLWQNGRHCHCIRLLKSAEIRVATDLSIFVKDGRSYEFRESGWRVQLVEAIAGHHLDVLFGGSLLDPISVAARDTTFYQE